MADQGSIANLKQNIDENIIQNTTKQITGTKMNTVLNNIVDTLNFNGRDFFNVNEYNEQATAYSNAADARADVPDEVKKLGLVITYLLADGWYIDQFIGSSTSGWATAGNWNVIGPVTVTQNAETGEKELNIGGEKVLVVEKEAQAGSKNPISSGGVYNLFEFPFTLDGFINGQGVFIEATGWLSTDYVPVFNQIAYQILSLASSGSSAIAFYDENKIFISKIAGTDTGSEETIKNGIVPENAFYARCCTYIYGRVNHKESFAVLTSKSIVNALQFAYEQSSQNAIKEIYNGLFSQSYTLDGFINRRGEFVEASYWKATDYIPVIDKTRYDIVANVVSGASLLAFYDGDKNFISSIGSQSQTTIPMEETGTIPEGTVYVRSCSYTLENTHFYLLPNFVQLYDNDNSVILSKNIKGLFLQNGYINTSGVFVSAQIWKSTDFIEVIKGASYHIKVKSDVACSLVAFYRKDKSFISSVRGTNETYSEITDIIPEGAYYIRTCTYGDDYTICDITNSVEQIFGILNDVKETNSIDTTGYIDFTVPINQYVVDNSDTQNHVIDDETDIINVNCILKLPSSYTPSGVPTRLIMICHGAGISDISEYKTQSYYNNLVNSFLSAGYGIFDCGGYANTNYGCNFWGAPKGVMAWRKAYDYVVNNYNVEKDICIYGFSMGGLTAMNLVCNNFPNVKCIALGSPVTDLYKCWESSIQGQMIAAYGINSWTQELYAGNNPMGNKYTENGIDYYRKQLPPLKIWYGGTETEDPNLPQVEKEDAKSIVNAIRNSNGTAFYREVAGCGHEICYGGNANVIAEIRMFFDRYSN